MTCPPRDTTYHFSELVQMKNIYRRRGRKSESAETEKELQATGCEEEGERCKEEGGEGRYGKEGECEDMEPAKARQMGKRRGGAVGTSCTEYFSFKNGHLIIVYF